ncbi:uncharacterized protein DUF4237 [Lentzea atacamensis]|uniref:Uncharacterized protein DUF4237 n=1 Tax=Lentzea atacamensis TaxID=531938 RepID=A0ABX9EEC8_9PSEU|nr:TNT domain-containing protein [Lentzea atacamensis]RAS68996.1 uncharacterized protein DUF4237 [Lentzea atacamensis]
MGIELPAELTEVAAKAGVSWPKADEDAMRSSAAAWREAGDKIKGLGTSSDGAATRALDGLTGATGDAARGRWAKVVAPDGELQRAARGCHAAADRLDHAAKQVGAAKVEIVRELVTLAKNNDAAKASATAGNPTALLGLDTLTRGTAANVANLHNTLSSAVRLDSGVDMSHASPPVNTAPGAHGPGGLLSPVTDIVGGVVAPVAGAVAPVVEPVAAVVAPVTEAVAPVVGAVTAPVAPVVGAVTAPVAPVVGAATEAAAPVLNAAAPVTAPAAAVVQPGLDAVPGARDTVGQVFDGRGEGPHGEGPGNGEGPGRGEGKPQVLPGLVAETGQAAAHVVPPVAAVAEVIPSVQGTLGPIAEGTTQASAAVLDQPLIRGGEMPGQAGPAPQAAPAAPAAPTGPTLGGAPGGGPVGGPIGAAAGAVGGAVGGVPSAAPAAGAQVGAVAGQQGGAQASGQQGQAQQAQQGAKAADAKAAEAKPGDAKAGPQAVAPKTGVPGAAQALVGQAGQALGNQPSGQSQFGNQPGQPQGGNQVPGQGQQGGQGQAGGKDALAKDPAKDALKDALLKDPAFGDAGEASTPGTQKVGETITAPSAPLAGVDLGAHQSGALTDRLDRLDNREQNQALSGVPGIAHDIARYGYTAAAAGSWFMAVFLSAGQAPRLAPKPARQLPAPAQQDEQVIPRFTPQDHPQADLVDASSAQPANQSEGLGKDHPVVQELLKDHDPLAGMHERDWESLFQHEDGTPRWPVEREGGYEDSRPEILEAGAELDRFGTPEGRVLSTAGTPFKERSLPPQAAEAGYRRYRVERDLPVHRTISAPWFGQPGGGSRYRTTYPVADLVALGYLTEITA